jgi:hypothetical protein
VIVVLVMSDGRRDYLVQSLSSANSNLRGPITTRVIHDDSGDSDFHAWLRSEYPTYALATTPARSGFGGAIQSAWAWLQANTVEPFCLHLEGDFTFNRPVPLGSLAATLIENPHLAQLVLRRQPWNDVEAAAGGIVEMWPAEYTERTSHGRTWLEHRLFLSTNPCLYRRSLLDVGWPEGDRSEVTFTQRLLADGFDGVPGEDVRFAFWGARDSGEAVRHIGHDRAGVGY